ncbi:hypothetical protein QBC35DRAFT_123973 [Podospora australis]|uniref:KOW domain-containing protein n=1 Tax=Podospora australis TaxID=1536484 RepID=A0AAN6WYF4_9PEZI|nr:hypothetical protein QBC35DRAFT_123973 [Podospora australis]
MDKILRRVRMAERQVVRRNKRVAEKNYAMEKQKRLRETGGMHKEAGNDLYKAIKARHEDLELGPIAPRRDVMQLDKFGNHWGSISSERALLSAKLTKEQKQARAAWCGGPDYVCLAVGDRVVVLDGPYRGQIAKIENIKRDTLALDLGMLQTNTTIPLYMSTDNTTPVEAINGLIPISSVRLVHPLPHPETGKVRDVIVRELKPVKINHDRVTRKSTWVRIIPGPNIRIPWPAPKPKKIEDYPVDTLRIDVEERTFVPTLLRAPMPETVLDELRNRYSKFRTRHTEEYIAKIQAEEDAKKKAKKAADKMLLPLQEYNRKLRDLRRARGQPVLTEEMLERIGEVIARNKALRESGGAASSTPSKPSSMEKVQKAVEQLSIADDAAKTPKTQPTA